MEGLIPQRVLWALLIGFDLVMLVWLLSRVSDFGLVASIWLIGLCTWAVAWRLTRPKQPPKRTRGRR